MKFFSVICALSVMFTGCGKSDDLFTVTLLTGLEKPVQSKNLMNGIVSSHLKITVPADACLQTNLLAGFKVGEDDLNLRTAQVQIITPFTAAPDGTLVSQTNPSAWLHNHADFDPIQFRVPAGITHFGVLGTIVDPTGSVGGSSCSDFDGGVPVANLSLAGTNRAEINGNTVLPLKLWVQNPIATPSPSLATICTSNDEDAASQACPARNFFRVKCTGTDCASPNLFKFEYLMNSSGTPHVTQWSSGTNNELSIPEMKPVVVTITNSASTPLGSVTFSRNSFSGGASVQAVPNTNASLALVQGGTTLSAPTLNVQQISCASSAGDATFSWNSVYGATSYSIYSGTTSGSTVTLEASGITSTSHTISSLNANFIGYYVVKATNGIDVVTSNEVAIQVVGMGTPTITGVAGSMFSVTAISTFTGNSQCQVYGDTSSTGSFATNLGVVSGAGGPTPGSFSSAGNYYAKLVCTNSNAGTCTYISGSPIAVP